MHFQRLRHWQKNTDKQKASKCDLDAFYVDRKYLFINNDLKKIKNFVPF